MAERWWPLNEALMVSHKNLLEEGSRPVEGSSSRTSLGQPIRAKAKLTCKREVSARKAVRGLY